MKSRVITFVIIISVIAAVFWIYKYGGGWGSDKIIKNPDVINNVNMAGSEKVQVKFSWELNGIKYTDAVYYSPEEYRNFSPDNLERIKQERFDNWLKSTNGN